MKQTIAAITNGTARPEIEPFDRQADQQPARHRPDNRTDASDAELPSRAVGAQGGRIDQGPDGIDAGLDTEHQEPGQKCRYQQGGL